MDFIGNQLSHSIIDIIEARHIEVPNCPTRIAHKMIMRLDKSIVAFQSLTKVQLLDLALLSQYMEISIDCAERDLR